MEQTTSKHPSKQSRLCAHTQSEPRTKEENESSRQPMGATGMTQCVCIIRLWLGLTLERFSAWARDVLARREVPGECLSMIVFDELRQCVGNGYDVQAIGESLRVVGQVLADGVRSESELKSRKVQDAAPLSEPSFRAWRAGGSAAFH
eukprot:6177148-Pleurochrysis_carterae.AAC.4